MKAAHVNAWAACFYTKDTVPSCLVDLVVVMLTEVVIMSVVLIYAILFLMGILMSLIGGFLGYRLANSRKRMWAFLGGILGMLTCVGGLYFVFYIAYLRGGFP
jgi:Na+/H+-translocating membrane pyrophosphatase